MNASSSTTSAGLQFTHPYLAVVLGGGFTGMLAAAALSEYADVVVVEREQLPRTPVLPTDLPQPRHTHLLAADGARVVESLLPGTIDGWLTAGARLLPMPSEPTAPLSPGRPVRRARTREVFACSRDLLDRVLREQVPALPGVRVLDGTDAERLTGTAEHVTGVWVRDTTSGETYRLDADLVVDATGRSSTTPDRLSALGLPTVPEDVRDPGIVCATRVFRVPAGYENCSVLTARSGHGRAGGAAGSAPAPESLLPAARTATLVPIEDGRWLVTLTGAGTGDERPSERADRFVPFARGVHTAIADLVTDAEPLSEVRLTRDTSSRRHRYEQLAHWPSGFLALGGAVASVNPDYGQGLSLAAHGAAALRAALRRYGLDDPALARRVQRTVGGLVEAPWVLATGAEPVPSPRPGAPRTSLASRVVRGAMSGLRTPAAGLPPVCRAYVDVVTPAVPIARLPRPFTPQAASAVRSPDLDTPDSTDAPSDLPSLFTAPAAALTVPPSPAAPAGPGPGPDAERAPRRLPRPLGFGPASLRLRRLNGGRRKPDGA
ncbi:NAD(P)/FAD-dependent oxidoreductase [Streptomyces noursei]|uniref:NAD(P)/FAD-dependent oxidoreductase n=1 Tax=Streptomyces noursei TaxID=1971 RepID=UPI001963E680|nr:FAD-dependent monooxygenase [Streptomyces noursei]QRX91692.1 FAD-dependent monooxygenase [Streptomyces noursei]